VLNIFFNQGKGFFSEV